jgi:hypothetical protein
VAFDTIPRNSRLIPGLQDRLTVCTRFDADNQYRGQSADPKHAWEKLAGDKTRRARLTFDGDSVYTITVHSRLWYELREAEPGRLTTDSRRRVRATEGSRAGQRGIVDGPPEQSIWLPITWDDGRTETYHAASVATVTDDPACAAGDGCHMRFDGTVWYAVDSVVAAHTHELPGWAAEEYEPGAGAGDKRERETERRWADDDELMTRGAEGSLRDPDSLARYQQALDRAQVARRTFAPPEPPEPTEASIRAVLEAAGINPDVPPPTARIWPMIATALKRGWVRGREDTLAELAGEPTREMPAAIEPADRDDPRYPWRLAWADGTSWRDFQRQGPAAVDYYAMTERPCAVYERQPDGRWYRTSLHKRAPR